MRLKVWLNETRVASEFIVASYRVTDGCLWMIFGGGKTTIIPLHRVYEIEAEVSNRVASV